MKKMTGKDEFEGIQKRMKEITIKSLQSVAEMVNSRKNSFELFGYDFMIDDTLKPWLIEINCSPTMEYSTVTEQEILLIS
jgi:D-alanine-D-alanine ligase-like ATP-grasp enzyme